MNIKKIKSWNDENNKNIKEITLINMKIKELEEKRDKLMLEIFSNIDMEKKEIKQTILRVRELINE